MINVQIAKNNLWDTKTEGYLFFLMEEDRVNKPRPFLEEFFSNVTNCSMAESDSSEPTWPCLPSC